jgi:hypothetical protein
VRPFGAVSLGEGVQECLELEDRRGLGPLGAQPPLEGLLEPFGFALGLRVVRLAVLLGDPELAQLRFQAVAAAPAAPGFAVAG